MKRTVIFPILIAITTLLVFTSCDDEDNPFYSPLVGEWELLEDRYGIVPQNMIDRFIFNDNGAGYYEGYNEYGKWDRWLISWSSYSDYRLVVRFEHGDNWYFYWDYDGDYLYLYEDGNRMNYYVYRPIFYW